MLSRCTKAGKEAMIIKTIDILDNSNFYHLASKERKKILLKKTAFAIKNFSLKLKNEPLFGRLKKKYKILLRDYQSGFPKTGEYIGRMDSE